LIDTFGKGWERGDVRRHLFRLYGGRGVSRDAVQHSRSGMAAIRAYWKDIPLYQAETDFSSGEIYARDRGLRRSFAAHSDAAGRGTSVMRVGQSFVRRKTAKSVR